MIRLSGIIKIGRYFESYKQLCKNNHVPNKHRAFATSAPRFSFLAMYRCQNVKDEKLFFTSQCTRENRLFFNFPCIYDETVESKSLLLLFFYRTFSWDCQDSFINAHIE